MADERIAVRLTKTSSIFGRLAKGSVLTVKVPPTVGDEREVKIRALRMLERDHPGEVPVEWEAAIAEEENG